MGIGDKTVWMNVGGGAGFTPRAKCEAAEQAQQQGVFSAPAVSAEDLRQACPETWGSSWGLRTELAAGIDFDLGIPLFCNPGDVSCERGLALSFGAGAGRLGEKRWMMQLTAGLKADFDFMSALLGIGAGRYEGLTASNPVTCAFLDLGFLGGFLHLKGDALDYGEGWIGGGVLFGINPLAFLDQ